MQLARTIGYTIVGYSILVESLSWVRGELDEKTEGE